MTKPNSKNYKLLVAISYSVKSLSAAIAGYEYMQEKTDAAFLVLIIGAVANEVVNIVSMMQND